MERTDNFQYKTIESGWKTYICKSRIGTPFDHPRWSIMLEENGEIKNPINPTTWKPTNYFIFTPDQAENLEYWYTIYKVAPTVSFTINGWDLTTYDREVNIELTIDSYTNITWYRISESSNLDLQFTSEEPTTFTLSEWLWVKTIYVQIKDWVGNYSNVASETIEFTVDTTPPEAPTLTVTPEYTNQDSVSVEVNWEVWAKVFVNWEDTWNVISESGTVNIDLDTSWLDWVKNFAITLKDALGNESDVLNLTVIKDILAPTVSGGSNNLWSVIEWNTFSWTVHLSEEVVITSVSWDNDFWISATSSYSGTLTINWIAWSAWNKSVTLNIKDKAWNVSNVTISIEVMADDWI